MSTDPKSPKPLPSVAEINAYLEQSAARTKLRLPLAKGAAQVDRGRVARGMAGTGRSTEQASTGQASANQASTEQAPTEQASTEQASTDTGVRRTLPVQVERKLPIQPSSTRSTTTNPTPAAADEGAEGGVEPEAWRPFSKHDEH